MKTREVQIAVALEEFRWVEKVGGWVELCSNEGLVEARESLRHLPDFAEPESGVVTEFYLGPWQATSRCDVHRVNHVGDNCPVCIGRYVKTTVGGMRYVPKAGG